MKKTKGRPSRSLLTVLGSKKRQPPAVKKRKPAEKPSKSTRRLGTREKPDSEALLQQENQKLQTEIARSRQQFELIRKTTLDLSSELSLEQILNQLVVNAKEFFHVDAVSCMLWDSKRKNLLIKCGTGFKTDYIHKQSIPFQRIKPILDSGYDHLYFENIQTTPMGDVALIQAEGLTSVLSLLIRFGSETLGALNLYSHNVRQFLPEEIENARIFVQQTAIAVRAANLYKEMVEESQIAKTLLQVAEEVGALNSLDEVTNRIVIILTRSIKFKIVMIFLWDDQKKIFLPSKAIGIPPHRHPLFHTLVLRKEELNFTDSELTQREVITAQNAPGRFPVEKLASVFLERDLRFVALVTKGKLLGAIVTAGYQGEEAFGHKDELFLRAIAAESAIAIDDAALFKALEEAFWDIIKSLAAAIEVKDSYTHSHSQSVINYATAIGEELHSPENEMKLLTKACLLHDLGKIGIDDGILQKVTPLTFHERKNIERHPIIGSQILLSVGSLSDVAIIVRHHHEQFDGSGYPDHLQGETIPKLARILAIADSFDAMTSDRPYRKALSLDQAIEQLKICSGKQFDPELVEVFLRVLDRKKGKWGLIPARPQL